MSQTRMTDAGGPASDADIERLAARLAMLASDGGEADNAGRAVGALARRIGLTGGDLKRIFLAGAASIPGGAGHEHPEDEVSTLRESMALLDADARHTAWERDVLRAENRQLQAAVERIRARARAWGVAGLGGALLLLSAGAVAWIGQPSPLGAVARPANEVAGLPRAAIVRPRGALLFHVPERNGVPLVALPGGQRVQVRRLVWKALFQWAEIELPGGEVGYVLTTEIDLS